MSEQLAVQACFLAYVFSFATTGLIWLVRRDHLDHASVSDSVE